MRPQFGTFRVFARFATPAPVARTIAPGTAFREPSRTVTRTAVVAPRRGFPATAAEKVFARRSFWMGVNAPTLRPASTAATRQ